MASTAIPFFFPPVKIQGHFYGDGCVRMQAPLSPAIHLGADQILAIGVQTRHPAGAPPQGAVHPKRRLAPAFEIVWHPPSTPS